MSSNNLYYKIKSKVVQKSINEKINDVNFLDKHQRSEIVKIGETLNRNYSEKGIFRPYKPAALLSILLERDEKLFERNKVFITPKICKNYFQILKSTNFIISGNNQNVFNSWKRNEFDKGIFKTNFKGENRSTLIGHMFTLPLKMMSTKENCLSIGEENGKRYIFFDILIEKKYHEDLINLLIEICWIVLTKDDIINEFKNDQEKCDKNIKSLANVFKGEYHNVAQITRDYAREYSISKKHIRNPIVRQITLMNSNHVCETCRRIVGNDKLNNIPVLEVHHKIPLGHGGADTLINCVALCPNCHRWAHIEIRKEELSKNDLAK